MHDEPNLAHLPALLRMSKSLVFVPDRATAKVVRKECHALGLPCLLSDDHLVAQIRNFERDKENFTTICIPSSMTAGWYSLAEQIIWVGPVPKDVSIYEQAYMRFPGMCTVHHIENWGTP